MSIKLQFVKVIHKRKTTRFFSCSFPFTQLYGQCQNNFSHIPARFDSNLIKFLDKYLKSPLSKYKDKYFYDFLRKLISYDSIRCLNWFFNSKPDCLIRDFYDKSPLNVLIEAYNGIREYEKDNALLDKAMDAFDSLLQISQYRNNHLRTFLRELTL